MKRPSAKRVSLYAGIAVSVVTVLWKVTPTLIRFATVPDKVDALTIKVDEITTIRHLIQGRTLVSSTNRIRDWMSFQ
jgi:hypothetical protein